MGFIFLRIFAVCFNAQCPEYAADRLYYINRHIRREGGNDNTLKAVI
ncbi:MAG: hypothetical protein MSJ26_03455 [Oscillospiraceae bacterium]|nr:hypothetical protein [Oscillospiraceae bacterium]